MSVLAKRMLAATGVASLMICGLGGTARAQTSTPAENAPNVLPETKVEVPKQAAKPEQKPRVVTREAAPAAPAPTAEQLQAAANRQVVQQTQNFDQRRDNVILPKIGTSNYELTQRDIENIPQANAIQFSDLALQFPGVSQDLTSAGDFHVRNEHANVQYRINGILLPDGVSGFSRTPSPPSSATCSCSPAGCRRNMACIRPAFSTSLRRAERHWRGAASASTAAAARPSRPASNMAGVEGKTDYFVTGRYLSTGLGLENPISSLNAIHDHSEAGRFFAYTSTVLDDPTSRVVTITGFGETRYQIPNNPGQPGNVGGFCGGPFDPANPCLNPDGTPNPNAPPDTAFGKSSFDSSTLNENQYEKNAYNVIAWQKSEGNFDAQLAYYSRYSDLHFVPDPVGDLFINNVASDVYRSSFLNGISGDFAYRLNDAHTLRAGFYTQGEQTQIATVSTVQPARPERSEWPDCDRHALQHSRQQQIVRLAARGLRPG